MADIIPKEALEYIKKKKLKTGFSYKDVWHEEHAVAFTVAKAMQLDVLSDLHNAVTQAVGNGQSFDTFRKNITPLLRQKGWWGRKQMTDPLTGQTVNAQLGSDRRLQTIYRVNMRSAYQKGQYERTMESDLHPYLMYRIGPSVRHREDHKSWDGLILPKDDPWWDTHFPPNGWGCKCYTRAVTEARKKQYETNGVPTAPNVDGSGGGNIQAKTQAPPVKYKTYFNERKGTVEQVPEGVDPAFNWNQGKAERSVTAYENLVQKTRQKAPEQFDLVMSSIMKNEVNKNSFYGFVEDALERKKDRQHAAPVGFLDTKITRFLEGKGITLGDHNIIVLESKLVNGKKYTGKHTRMGNAPSKDDWYNLLDWLLDAAVYYDAAHKGLAYLARLGTSRYMKIAVDLSLDTGNHRGVRLLLPKVDTMYVLDLSVENDRGLDEYNRITRFEKIR
jgi:SPP1 gp7 family putative phage head morphogenesis protein